MLAASNGNLMLCRPDAVLGGTVDRILFTRNTLSTPALSGTTEQRDSPLVRVASLMKSSAT